MNLSSGLATAVIPVLAAVAVAVWTVPARPVRKVVGSKACDRVPGSGGGPVSGSGPGRQPESWRGRVRRWRERVQAWGRREKPLDLGEVLTEVAARLQAGEPPAQAWQRALPAGSAQSPVVDDDGVPAALEELLPPRPGSGRAGQERLALAHQVTGAQVACRMAHTVGAPLAQVLQASAAGVAEAGRAQAARRAALAAPRATARLLGWLPLAALVLGSAWGAAPVRVLLDGGWGTACLVTGGILMVLGHLWSARLVRTAERVGA